MKLDFALILTALSAFTGIVWLIDHLLFAKKRALMVKDGEEVSEPALVDYARSLFPVLFFVLAIAIAVGAGASTARRGHRGRGTTVAPTS